MGSDDFAVLCDAGHIVGRRRLTGMGPYLMDPGVEFGAAAHQYLQTHGSGDIGLFGQQAGIIDRQSANGGHDLGAVDQRQAFTGFELQRFHTALAKCLPAG